jgi:hypothetical protein
LSTTRRVSSTGVHLKYTHSKKINQKFIPLKINKRKEGGKEGVFFKIVWETKKIEKNSGIRVKFEMSTPRKNKGPIKIRIRRPFAERNPLPGIAEVERTQEFVREQTGIHVPGITREMGKNFEINNKRLLLTYKTHIDKTELEEFLWMTTERCREELAPGEDSDWACYIAHETSDKANAYDHTHVYLDVGIAKAFRSKMPRVFDFNGIHPNIQKITRTHERVIAYVCKQDPLLAHIRKEFPMDSEKVQEGKKKVPKSKMPWERIAKCKTLGNAMSMMTKWGDATGIRSAWEASRMEKIEVNEGDLRFKPWGWQLDLFDLIRIKRGNPRTIHWWWSEEGETGKTSFTGWITAKFPKLFLRQNGIPYCRDMATIIKDARETGWTGHGIIFDLPRNFEKLGFIWETLENVKNGSITATKYHGGTTTFQKPHVVVLANFPPKSRKEAKEDGDKDRLFISKDRLKVVEIETTPRPEHYPEEWGEDHTIVAKLDADDKKYIFDPKDCGPDEEVKEEEDPHIEPSEEEEEEPHIEPSEDEEDIPTLVRVSERNRLGETPEITVFGKIED